MCVCVRVYKHNIRKKSSTYICMFFSLFFFFRAVPAAYRRFKSEVHLILSHSHGKRNARCEPHLQPICNARSLTHRVSPGIEPTSSWILVRFLTCWATMGTPRKYNSLILCLIPTECKCSRAEVFLCFVHWHILQCFKRCLSHSKSY